MARAPPPDSLSFLPASPTRQSLRARSPHPPIVRIPSSHSVAGNAAYSAAPPPLPPLDKRILPFSSSRAANRPRWPRRRPRLAAFLILVAVVLLALFYFSTPVTDFLFLARFKLRDLAFDQRWSSPILLLVGLRTSPCQLRKEPLLFVRGEGQTALVWETNGCREGAQAWTARLGLATARHSAHGTLTRASGKERQAQWRSLDVQRTVVQKETAEQGGRIVHTAHLDGLQGGELYQYELALTALPSRRTSTLVRHAFPWLGVEVSHEDRPTTLHIACVADNQYNLRIFRRVLVRLLSFASSLPTSRYFPTSALPRPFTLPSLSHHSPLKRPHLLLHAGDAVQNPHALAQWQTDFWDPLTRGLGARWPAGQKTPVLLARGNHDWDETGSNVYTGGGGLRRDRPAGRFERNDPLARRGTYYAFSPHARMRIVVLDSNLPSEDEQLEQERWLEWEVGRDEWTSASFKVAVVHTAPFIEWWDTEAWTAGRESEWSSYVRARLVPLLSRANCALVLSGHSHAYTRGFLPTSLVSAFSSAPNSSAVPPAALSSARAHAASSANDEVGMLLVTFGGAGGTLDDERVEDWGFMRRSISERYHAGWIAASFAGAGGVEPPAAAAVDEAREEEVFRVDGVEARCDEERGKKRARDVLEWRAVGLEGGELDRWYLVADSCV
ncbi:metallophosphoesterase family protein [Rhodotorula paludigena]|uniref:metallophosphoesterase family protein n=1 Tax=Rhodotorula paludigena TaxID=86838 RepID=UPI003180B317